MHQITLSLRNLLRNKRRTMITLAVIVFGVAGILIFAGYVDYSMWGLRENTIHRGLGHIQVFQEGYNAKNNQSHLDFLINNPGIVFKQIMRLPHVKEATSELSLRGLLSTGDRTEMTESRGYDLQWAQTIKKNFSMVRGTFLNEKDRYHMLLGQILAEKLNSKPGDLVTLMTTTKDGALNAYDVTIKGIIKTGIKEMDSTLSVIPISLAQELLNVQGIEKFIVILDKTENTAKVAELLIKLNKNQNIPIEIKNWFELADFYKRVKALYESFLSVTITIIIVIVIFSIVNTMSMIIFERMREIGTIRALGMTKSKIIYMFITEGLWLGIFGIIIGIAVSELIGLGINASGGIYIPPPPTSTEGYYAMISPNAGRYLDASLVALFSVIIGSIIPAIKAAKLKIDEALRYI
jgi:putative ABC transport system permease protein